MYIWKKKTYSNPFYFGFVVGCRWNKQSERQQKTILTNNNDARNWVLFRLWKTQEAYKQNSRNIGGDCNIHCLMYFNVCLFLYSLWELVCMCVDECISADYMRCRTLFRKLLDHINAKCLFLCDVAWETVITPYIDYLHTIEYRPYIGKKYNATEYRHYRNYAIALHKMFPFISINWHKSNLYLVEYVCAIFVCNTVHISLSLCLQSIWVCVVAIKRIVWYVCLCNIEKIYTITRFEWKLQCLKIY